VVATVGCRQLVSPFVVTVSDEMKVFVRACAVYDGQQTKAIGRDEVSSTIPAENESAGALSEEGDEGRGGCRSLKMRLRTMTMTTTLMV